MRSNPRARPLAGKGMVGVAMATHGWETPDPTKSIQFNVKRFVAFVAPRNTKHVLWVPVDALSVAGTLVQVVPPVAMLTVLSIVPVVVSW